jgi:LysR family transcriptional regulator of beta-lactamase
VLRAPLLRSYRPQDWPAWFHAAGLEPRAVRGPLFDSSLIMVQAAMLGEGVALAPHGLFRREIEAGQIVQPFAIEAKVDGYWFTRLKSRPPSNATRLFQTWLIETFKDGLTDRPPA